MNDDPVANINGRKMKLSEFNALVEKYGGTVTYNDGEQKKVKFPSPEHTKMFTMELQHGHLKQ
jgi:hypothetical protein